VIVTPAAILFAGFIGGFVGLQRRLKTMPADDLELLAESWVCTALSPIAGAILAELVYLLFISQLLSGNLFPAFVLDPSSNVVDGKSISDFSFRTIFQVHCSTPFDYAKLLFWGFVAGFSERFATNIISQFDNGETGKPSGQDKASNDPAAIPEPDLPPGEP
jgi:hypothetical protein